MGASVVGIERDIGTVRVLFELVDDRTKSLANHSIRWIPSVHELQAIERSTANLQAGIAVHWPVGALKYGIPQIQPTCRKTVGCVLTSSDYVTLGFEAAANAMGALITMPVIVVQIAGNPRAFWLPPPLSALEWHCRPADFLAVALHLGRLYRGLSITAPDELRRRAKQHYEEVQMPPFSRLIT